MVYIAYPGFFCQPTLSYLSLPHPTLYSTASIPHPTSSYTGFFCHPTISYPVVHSLSQMTVYPTSSYTGRFCHPTLSYLILPSLNPYQLSYPVLPHPTLYATAILPHPNWSQETNLEHTSQHALKDIRANRILNESPLDRQRVL